MKVNSRALKTAAHDKPVWKASREHVFPASGNAWWKKPAVTSASCQARPRSFYTSSSESVTDRRAEMHFDLGCHYQCYFLKRLSPLCWTLPQFGTSWFQFRILDAFPPQLQHVMQMHAQKSILHTSFICKASQRAFNTASKMVKALIDVHPLCSITGGIGIAQQCDCPYADKSQRGFAFSA